MRAGVVVFALAGCGRFGFGRLAADTASGDAAGDVAGDGSSGFCATLGRQVTLCDDFDEGQSLTAGWTTPEIQGGGMQMLTMDSAKSPPAAALHTFPAQTVGTTVACLDLTLSTTP